MKRDFNLRFDDVELVGGGSNFLKDSKVTKFILRGSNELLSLDSMFKDCKHLHTVDGNFDLTDIPSIKSLFEGCVSLVEPVGLLFNGDIDMSRAFYGCDILPVIKLGNTTLVNFTSLEGAFDGCPNLDGISFVGSTSKESVKTMMNLLSPIEED